MLKLSNEVVRRVQTILLLEIRKGCLSSFFKVKSWSLFCFTNSYKFSCTTKGFFILTIRMTSLICWSLWNKFIFWSTALMYFAKFTCGMLFSSKYKVLYSQLLRALWKKSQAYYSGGIQTHNPCNSRAVSYQLDHQKTFGDYNAITVLGQWPA